MRGRRNEIKPNEKGLYEGVVYRYENKAEGDECGWCYIGCTIDEKHRRYSWNNHGNKSYGGQKISKARVKFGLESFDYKVLERVEAESVEELHAKLEDRESAYIKQFNSIEKGYNSSEGGSGHKGGITEEHRINIGKASTGRWKSQATKDKISASLKGRVVSEETKKKISAGNKGKIRSEEVRKAQSEMRKGQLPKHLYEGNKRWRENGGTLKGYKHSETVRAHMSAAQKLNGTKTKITFPDGTVKIYPTMLDAAKGINVNVGSIEYYAKRSATHTTQSGYIIEKAA